MGEGEVPPSAEQRQTRADWQKQRVAHNTEHRGAIATQRGNLMLQPDTLLSHEPRGSDRPTNAEILGHLIENARFPNGTFRDRDIIALGASPFWNDLIAGKDIPTSELAADPVTHAYLSKRSRDVAEADEEIREEYPEIRNLFQQGLGRAAREGYVPTSVLEHIDSALNNTTVQVVDEAILNYGSEGIQYGEYIPETDIAYIAHDSTGIEQKITVVHELLHKLSGGKFNKGKSGFVSRNRMGFLEVSAGGLVHTGLTEAIDHHLALGIVTNDFDTLDPDERSDGDDKYYEYRKLLSVMIGLSRGIIDLKSITRASFEDNSQAENRLQMVRQARKAYGNGAFRKLDKLCRAIDELDPRDSQYATDLTSIINRIQGPVVDADGIVKQIGTIDITGLE